jgi:hypothetical protein
MYHSLIEWAAWFLSPFLPISMIVTGVVVFILEAGFGIRAEYGRYNKSNKGFSAPIAWCLQESPAFLIPCLFLYFGNQSLFNINTGINLNVLFIIFFMIHYFNR